MSLRYRWNEEQIRKEIKPALNSGGEARVRFNFKDEAEKFRFACYSLRHRKGIGKDLSFVLQTYKEIDSSGEETTVFEIFIKRTPTINITSATEEAAS